MQLIESLAVTKERNLFVDKENTDTHVNGAVQEVSVDPAVEPDLIRLCYKRRLLMKSQEKENFIISDKRDRIGTAWVLFLKYMVVRLTGKNMKENLNYSTAKICKGQRRPVYKIQPDLSRSCRCSALL